MGNATTTFTLGGSTNAALGFQVSSQRSHPILPRTWDLLERIAGQHGQLDYGAKLRERVFEFECVAVDVTTSEELEEFRQTLAAYLVDTDGDPQDLELYFADETDRTYTVRYSGKLEMSREAGNTLGYFRLVLIAFDPFGYADEVQVSENVTAAPHDIALTNLGTIATPEVISVTNSGGSAITTPSRAISLRCSTRCTTSLRGA